MPYWVENKGKILVCFSPGKFTGQGRRAPRVFCSSQEEVGQGLPPLEKQHQEEAGSLDWNPPAPQWDRMKHWRPKIDQLPLLSLTPHLTGLSCFPDFIKWTSALAFGFFATDFCQVTISDDLQVVMWKRQVQNWSHFSLTLTALPVALCLRSQPLYPWGPYEWTCPGSSSLCLLP